MACGFSTKTLLFVIAVIVVPTLSAPTLKSETSENKASRGENHVPTDEEQERIVARLILQLGRDYDEGRLSLLDLVGRSAVDEDSGIPEIPAEFVPQDFKKPTGVKTGSGKKPVRTT